MGDAYWYAYDRSGAPSGPYYESRSDARDAAGDGASIRPIDESVLVANADIITADGDGDESESADADLDDLSHEELKAEAERRGVADEIDLRSKDSIIDALS